MKKICFIVAIPGTAESFLYKHMSDLGEHYEVHLIADFQSEDQQRMFSEAGVVCHNAPIKRPIRLFSDLKAMLSLMKIFRAEQFRAVHSVTPKAGLLTSVAGWMARVPHRIHIYTGQVWSTQTGFMRFLLKTMDRIIALLNTEILVDGEGQRQYLIAEKVINETGSKVLANGSIAGVELDKFVVSDAIRARERTRFNMMDTDVVYVFLGRLNHDKGIGELFMAFDRLAAECDNVRLVLYGTDEEGYDSKVDQYANIRRNINYHYPGRTDHPYESLQVGDVFVIPTWREGFGMSVIEAQGLGLPVITSDAYGVVDASVEGKTGLRCKVGDPETLYLSMKKYHSDSELRMRHGSEGRKRVRDLFDNKLVGQAWVDYYDELLNYSK
jgi:glycosyltransferase involved in cell wall biosynthesis